MNKKFYFEVLGNFVDRANVFSISNNISSVTILPDRDYSITKDINEDWYIISVPDKVLTKETIRRVMKFIIPDDHVYIKYS